MPLLKWWIIYLLMYCNIFHDVYLFRKTILLICPFFSVLSYGKFRISLIFSVNLKRPSTYVLCNNDFYYMYVFWLWIICGISVKRPLNCWHTWPEIYFFFSSFSYLFVLYFRLDMWQNQETLQDLVSWSILLMLFCIWKLVSCYNFLYLNSQ